MKIKVAIVEDNEGIRESWVRSIGGATGFEVVCACPSAEDAVERIPPLRPDVVLMDIHLPGSSGIECTARLKQILPQTQILMVTVYNDSRRVFQALQAGASGYLLKRTKVSELLQAIRNVIQGGGPMSGEIARKVIEAFQRPAPATDTSAVLSQREQDVLEILSQGFSNKEIASRLNISAQTVNSHLKHIYEKLHVRSRTEAVLKFSTRAGKAGLTEPIAD
jgi:DNA-binding NarL/FixJ family response regulator